MDTVQHPRQGEALSANDNTRRTDYYRRDQRDGISPPDLSKDCTYAEHIVRARGKRTKYTSVSLDPVKIRDFGDTLYKLRRLEAEAQGHHVIEHETLLKELRRVIQEEEKIERMRAIHALRYATARVEGLVCWTFDLSAVARKDLISWAASKVQPFFSKV